MAAPCKQPEIPALLDQRERQWRAGLTLAWPAALLAAPVLVAANGVTLCAFRALSGLPCPLCGGTHACAALIEGQWLAAWQANPGLLPLLAIAAAHTLQLANEAVSGQRIGRWRIGQQAWLAGSAILVVGWGLRLLGQL